MHYASQNGHLDAVKLLVLRDAAVNVSCDVSSRTYVQMQSSHRDVIFDFLL